MTEDRRAGQLLAAALEESGHSGEAPRVVLDRRAYQRGRELGEAARADNGAVVDVLEAHGYEPRGDGGGISLVNCPIHSLAKAHTELVCEMNLQLLHGVLHGLADTGMTAALRPTPEQCCVSIEPAGTEQA